MALLTAVTQLRQPTDLTNQTESQTPLTDLITSLEHATLASKQLLSSPSSTPSQTLIAVDSLRHARDQIETFLSRFQCLQTLDAEVDETMADLQLDQEEERGDDSRSIEEGMRGCVLQRKRRKRHLSPSLAADRTEEFGVREFSSLIDPRERVRSLDLIFQFHG